MESLHEFDFPNYDDYKANLVTLDNFDFKNLSSEEIYYKYFDLARTIPLCYKIIKKSEFNKFVFYRARINIDQSKEDISLISTYSFPPPIFCNENGRANLSKKSVFYCSDNPISAVKECKPNDNDEGFLGIWKTNAVRNIKSCLFLPRDLTEQNNWSKIAKQSFKNFTNDAAFKKLLLDKQLNALHHFVNFKYKYEPSPYNLTSIISDEVLYGEKSHDFLVYSSVFIDKFCNMAFHPNSALENLRLEKVIRFKIKDIQNGHLGLGDVGHIINSKIVWKKMIAVEKKIFE